MGIDYKGMIESMPIGYAHHRIIIDESDKPVDYEYIEINESFERQTGLKREYIIGKRVTEVVPGIEKSEFDWIAFFGQIAISGEADEIEQYSESLERWYKVHAVCPKRGEFIAYVSDITEEKRELEEKMAILKASNDIVFELDENYRYTNFIAEDEGNLFLPKERYLGKRVDDILTNNLGKRVISALDRAKASQSNKETLIYKSILDGDNRWFYSEIRHMSSRKGPVFVMSIQDISKEKYLEEELKSFCDINLDLLCIVDLRGRFIKVNGTWEEILGHSKRDIEGELLLDYVHPDDMGKTLIAIDEIKNSNSTISFTNRYRSKDGNYKYIEWRSSFKGGRIYASARDISERVEKQERVMYLSYHDQLTELYNRRFFEEELKRLDQPRNLPLSLVMIDVNGLKLVNDAFGHVAGDKLLEGVANALRRSCRADDIVARIGGDEFSTILPKTSKGDARRVVERIYTELAKENIDLAVVSASVGYGTKESSDESIERALKRSEDEMYKKKLIESKAMREKTLTMIIQKLFEIDLTGEEHSERVAESMVLFGEAMGFKSEEVASLEELGRIHDIGLIVADRDIINKSESLDGKEWEAFKRHSEVGYQILKSVNRLAPLAEYVLSHHERIDGKGYPSGLIGDEIPLQARMLSIADAYSAILSDRPYRCTRSSSEAIEKLKANAGTQFDEELVDIFIKEVLMRETPR